MTVDSRARYRLRWLAGRFVRLTSNNNNSSSSSRSSNNNNKKKELVWHWAIVCLLACVSFLPLFHCPVVCAVDVHTQYRSAAFWGRKSKSGGGLEGGKRIRRRGTSRSKTKKKNLEKKGKVEEKNKREWTEKKIQKTKEKERKRKPIAYPVTHTALLLHELFHQVHHAIYLHIRTTTTQGALLLCVFIYVQ